MKDSTTGCKVGGLEMEQVTCNCNRVGIALSFIDDRSRGTQSIVVMPLAQSSARDYVYDNKDHCDAQLPIESCNNSILH